MKRSIFTILLTLSIPVIAGADRDFIFDIHDATSTTEQYINEAVIVPVYETAYGNLQLSDDFAGELPDFYDELPTLLQTQSFDPAGTATATFSNVDYMGNTFTMIASGLGVSDTLPFSLESFRRCFARALCEAERNNIQTVHIALPTCVDGTIKQIAQEIAAITYLALYQYTALQTVKVPYAVKRVCLHAHMPTPNDFKDVNIGLRIGSNLGNTICQARDWINTPANLMTPTILATNSAQYVLPYIAKIETIIFEQQDITRMGMGGLLGVSQGSDQPCTFVVHYLKCRYPNVPTIAIVGNGITYDTNEPNISMSGAIAAFTALNVIAYRNIPANIVILAPLAKQVENAYAFENGDIVQMRDGKKVEIQDTDAAGQLMLADAFTHAITRYNPDYIIDISTLTPASKQTFGGCYAAMMSNDDELLERAQRSAVRTGEPLWQLPLNDAYTARLASIVADLSNASSVDRTAQTQIAGCFLQQFINNTPWLHIDISGAQTAQEYSANGAPAFGIRLLIDLVESLARGAK
jgi:leucyl aminopeptidase